MAVPIPALLMLLVHAFAAGNAPAGSTGAAPGDPPTPMHMARSMSRWVAAQMRLSRPPTPSIAQVPAATLSRMVWGGPPPPGAHLRIESLYERGADTIYLRDDWDGADVVQRSHLVHELVHHFQHFHGIVAACPAALEMQAYAVQVKWLAEQGIADGYAALGTDEATVRLLALCP